MVTPGVPVVSREADLEAIALMMDPAVNPVGLMSSLARLGWQVNAASDAYAVATRGEVGDDILIPMDDTRGDYTELLAHAKRQALRLNHREIIPLLLAECERLRAENLEFARRAELGMRRCDGGPYDLREHVQSPNHFADMGTDCACECVRCYRSEGRDPCICAECPGKFHTHGDTRV